MGSYVGWSLLLAAFADVDVTSGPTTPYSSVEHGKFTYAGYTGVYNLLDYSAVSFPCSVNVDAKVDAAYSGHRPLSEIDAQVQGDCEFRSPGGRIPPAVAN